MTISKTVFHNIFIVLISTSITLTIHGMKNNNDENKQKIGTEEVTLVAQDGQTFKILLKDLNHIQTIINILEDHEAENPIPFPTISAPILKIIIESEQMLKSITDTKEKIKALINYIKEKNLTINRIQELLKTSFYLDFEPLIKACEVLIGYDLLITDENTETKLNPFFHKDTFVASIISSLFEYGHLLFGQDKAFKQKTQKLAFIICKLSFTNDNFLIMDRKTNKPLSDTFTIINKKTGKIPFQWYFLLINSAKAINQTVPEEIYNIIIHNFNKFKKNGCNILLTTDKTKFLEFIQTIIEQYQLEFIHITTNMRQQWLNKIFEMRQTLKTIKNKEDQEKYWESRIQLLNLQFKTDFNKENNLKHFFNKFSELKDIINDENWIEYRNDFFKFFLSLIIKSYDTQYQSIQTDHDDNMELSSHYELSSFLAFFLSNIEKSLESSPLFISLFTLFLENNFTHNQWEKIFILAIKSSNSYQENNKTAMLILTSIIEKLTTCNMLEPILKSQGKKALYKALDSNEYNFNFDVVNYIVQQLESYNLLHELLTKGYGNKEKTNILELALESRNLEIVKLIFEKISQLNKNEFLKILDHNIDEEKKCTILWHALVMSANPLIAEYILTKFQELNIFDSHIKYLLQRNKNIAFNLIDMAIQSESLKVLKIIIEKVSSVLNKEKETIICEKSKKGKTHFISSFETAYVLKTKKTEINKTNQIEILKFIIEALHGNKLQELLNSTEEFEILAPKGVSTAPTKVVRTAPIWLKTSNKNALLLLATKLQDAHFTHYIIKLFLKEKIELWEPNSNYQEFCENLLEITRQKICGPVTLQEEIDCNHPITHFWNVMLLLATGLKNIDFINYVIKNIKSNDQLKITIFTKENKYYALLLQLAYDNNEISELIDSVIS